MSKRKMIGGILAAAGIAILAVPFFWRYQGTQETEQIIKEFEQGLEERQDGERKAGEGQASPGEAEEAVLQKDGLLGILEIEGIGIRYPVMEGTGPDVLNAGIGHIPETAGIGEQGNCVLCGHNGSRYGTFFTPLNQVEIGDAVSILDQTGDMHWYEVAETFLTGPYDNSIKNQGEREEVTLFTCARKGTMRFVVKCVPKEEANGE